MLINRIRSIRDQLPEEDLAIGVERMNHQLKQTLCFSLKAHRLCGVSRHNRFLAVRVGVMWGSIVFFQGTRRND